MFRDCGSYFAHPGSVVCFVRPSSYCTSRRTVLCFGMLSPLQYVHVNGMLSLYSDFLRAGRSRVRIPIRGRSFSLLPNVRTGSAPPPPILLFNGYRVLSGGGGGEAGITTGPRQGPWWRGAGRGNGTLY
jgi:hypothetical protein